MAIDGVNSSTAGNSALVNSRIGIADNFDTFLSILTTQLRNQNPLDPLDTNQFTSQLVQFTGVEQQLKTNEFLEALLLTSQNANTANALSLIGKSISASSVVANLEDGKASWGYTAGRGADTAIIGITNATGDLVYSAEIDLEAGAGVFEWDGVGNDGTTYADGNYSIVIDARDASGYRVDVAVQTSGTVEGVDLTGATPVLIVDGKRIDLASVTAVSTGT